MDKLFKDYCCNDTRFNSSISAPIIDNASDQESDSSTGGSISCSMDKEKEEAVPLPVNELICYYGALTSLEASFNNSLQLQAERFEVLLQETKSQVSQKF
jgi:hypothetical protein